MNTPDEKTFKQLWRELSKAGWKARKPKGLSVDFTYVKPGVTGRLDSSTRGNDHFIGENELMAFARQSGVLQLQGQTFPYATLAGEVPGPTCLSEPSTEPSAPVSDAASMSVVVSPTQTLSLESSVSIANPSTATPTATVEYAQETIDVIQDRVEEAYEETKTDTGNDNALDVFDTDHFMEALRTERLFGPLEADDVNLCKVPFHDEDEVDDGEDALDVPSADHSDYESDVDSDEDFEDDSDAFQQDDVAMRTLGDSGWKIYDEFHCGELQLPGADDLYSGTHGVTKSAAAFGKSPLGMFFYFLPKSLWLHIATETNEYRVQCIPRDAENIRKKQLEAQAKDPRKTVQPHAEIVAKLERVKPIKPYEIVHVIGLLTARTLCSHTDGLDKHWATREDGAVPRGTFGRYMKRDRFRTVTRYLPFSSNTASSATTDKAWKVRPVLQTIERTFRRGYRMGARVSFDEGTIPNRSQFNPIRVYNKDKPHKYGTKCYMTCCAETGYCSRVEVYLGAVMNKQKSKGVPQKAVIRNVAKTFEGQQGKRLIIADNFYTSCSLALKLLEMGFYYVGTHRKARLGWPRSLPFAQKSRPRGMARGTYRIAQAVQHPDLVAVAWMDSTPVHLIATGCSTNLTSVTRKQKMASSLERVPCSQLIADYHAGMGGVDSHDQLRLQSYSLQQCVAFKKYYRQLFLGFVDMAIVNGFIIHKLVMKKCGERVPTHAGYMRRLHLELMSVSAATFEANLNAEDLVSVPLPAGKHCLRNNNAKYRSKRRQHLCKVCSAMADPNTKSFESSYYCPTCEDQRGGYVPLCAKIRRENAGNTLTCSQIWHTVWGCGTLIPAHLRKNIRYRKRKREDPEEEDAAEERDVDYIDREGDSN